MWLKGFDLVELSSITAVGLCCLCVGCSYNMSQAVRKTDGVWEIVGGVGRSSTSHQNRINNPR